MDQSRGDALAARIGNKARFHNGLSIPDSMRILAEAKNGLPSISSVQSPGLSLPKLSPDTTERVFPIRSVVSVDSPTPTLLTPSLEITESKPSPFGEGSLYVPPRETETSPSEPYGRMSKDGDHSSSFCTSKSSGIRGEHRDRGPCILTAVQPFGTLIVMQEFEGNLAVQVVSNNCEVITGYTSDALFELNSFSEIVRQDQKDDFLYHAKFIAEEEHCFEQHGSEIVILSLSMPDGNLKRFWCTMHAPSGNPDLIICELEPEEDSMSIFNLTGDRKPNEQVDEILESKLAKNPEQADEVALPPRALRIFGERKREFDFTNILNAMSRVLQLAWNAQSLEVLFNSVISVIQQLIGFQRVTVYQFDSDWKSIALADVVDHASPNSSGPHLPASTPSEHLRRLHLQNKVCLLYNQYEPPAELVYRRPADAAKIDMTHSYLLSAPVTSEFLDPMPAHTGMSIGIYIFGNLWGLISCQSYDGNTQLLPPIHKLCWHISNTISSNMERLSYTVPFNVHKSSTAEVNVYKCDTAPAGDILSLFGADCGASSVFGETKILGKPSDSQEVLAVVEYLRSRALDRILWSEEITKDFQDLKYPPGFNAISGLLYIPLSVDGRDFIIFCRELTSSAYVEHVSAAFRSFRTSWHPEGKTTLCRPHAWSAVDLGKAYILSVVHRTFVEVWQQKEAALQSTQLMRLLLANSAHEFRTPLNAIINYLEIALDGSLAQETRENLSRSHSASKSLIYIINDLLDLTNAENGHSLIKDEVFNLSETLSEATDIFWEEARQKHVDVHIVQHSQLPLVLGDQRRVRQVITNLISNAVQHTPSGCVTIESCILPDKSESGKIAVEVAIHDTGAGMSQETVEALFCELEQVSNRDYILNRCKAKSAKGGESKNILGLGLALVARIVRNMNGQLSVKSEKDEGSCFKIRLKFPLPFGGGEFLPLQELHLDGRQPEAASECQSMSSGQDENRSCGKDLFPSADSGSPVNISAKTDEGQFEHPAKPDTTPTWLPLLEPVHNKPTRKTPAPEVTPVPPANLPQSTKPSDSQSLHILVAEDDPINSTIVKKRLTKSGHTVHMTGNGKECASAYASEPGVFDAVLMDLQVFCFTWLFVRWMLMSR